jgi:hypothetical protein
VEKYFEIKIYFEKADSSNRISSCGILIPSSIYPESIKIKMFLTNNNGDP